jgi:hypothetical protein
MGFVNMARTHIDSPDGSVSVALTEALTRNGAWKVTRRTIVLDANVLLNKNLSVFL